MLLKINIFSIIKDNNFLGMSRMRSYPLAPPSYTRTHRLEAKNVAKDYNRKKVVEDKLRTDRPEMQSVS